MWEVTHGSALLHKSEFLEQKSVDRTKLLSVLKTLIDLHCYSKLL